jgi:hypothetical protein
VSEQVLKAGDRVYRVYDGWSRNPRVGSAVIERVSLKQIKITREGGVDAGPAFGFRSTFDAAASTRWGRTENEAWQIFADERQAEIARMEQDLVALREKYHHAIDQLRGVHAEVVTPDANAAIGVDLDGGSRRTS